MLDKLTSCQQLSSADDASAVTLVSVSRNVSLHSLLNACFITRSSWCVPHQIRKICEWHSFDKRLYVPLTQPVMVDAPSFATQSHLRVQIQAQDVIISKKIFFLRDIFSGKPEINNSAISSTRELFLRRSENVAQ